MLLFTGSLLLLASLANSEPITNSEPLEQPTRHHNWNGVVSILFSCFSTLSLAVYTALHLNINPSHWNWWKRFAKTLVWIIIAMVFPEWVVWCAISQFILAQKVRSTALHMKMVDVRMLSTQSGGEFVCSAILFD